MLFLSALSIVFANGKNVVTSVEFFCIVRNILILLLLSHCFSNVIMRAGGLILIHSFALISVLFLARNKANRSDKKKDNGFHVVDFDPNVIKN